MSSRSVDPERLAQLWERSEAQLRWALDARDRAVQQRQEAARRRDGARRRAGQRIVPMWTARAASYDRHRPVVAVWAGAMPGTREDLRPTTNGSETAVSEALFEMLFEHSLEAVTLDRPSGAILYVNPAACQLFRATKEELCRSGRSALLDAEHPAWQAMLTERAQHRQARAVGPMYRRDGTSFLADAASAVFQSAAGEELSCWILRDVTERERRERKVAAYKDVVEALLAGADLPAVLALIARHARIIFDATDAEIVAAADSPDDVVVAAAEGPTVSRLLGRGFPGGSLARQVMEAREALLVDDTTDIAPFEEVRDMGLGPAMVAPIVSGEKVFGVLFVAAVRDARGAYGPDDLDQAAGFAQEIGLAIAIGEARAQVEREQRNRADQLETALETRVVIEQAKGVISALRAITPDEAFRRLRAYARSHSENVHITARAVIDRKLLV